MNNFRLRSGDILININSGKDPWSVVRRWAIGEYSHVFMYMGTVALYATRRLVRLTRVPMLFESFGRGVCLRLLSDRYEQEVVVMRLKPEFGRRRIPLILEEALKLASDPRAYYDYLCVIKFILLRIIWQKLPLSLAQKMPLSWHRDSRQICSEAVLEIYLRAGVPILDDDIVPLPGDFTESLLLEEIGRGKLSEKCLEPV